MNLQISYPFKPYFITQVWNNPNPAYEQFGFGHHNGIDANVGRTGDIRYQTEFPVYCPVSSFTVQLIRWNPTGGGNEVWLVSDDQLTMDDRTSNAYMVLCHAKKILVNVGDKPVLGQLLMIADNTGFSTGPHTHMGLYRVNYDGTRITNYYDVNDANNSYNPGLFFTGQYAIDQATVGTLVKNGLRLAQYYLTGG